MRNESPKKYLTQSRKGAKKGRRSEASHAIGVWMVRPQSVATGRYVAVGLRVSAISYEISAPTNREAFSDRFRNIANGF